MLAERMTREGAIRIGVEAAIEQVDFWDGVINNEDLVSNGAMERSQARARIIKAAAFLVAEGSAVNPLDNPE